MATFIGYSTIGQYKNYTLTDDELIKRDILNSLSIRQGESLMRPLNGTSMWDFIFEPVTQEIIERIEDEVKRVIDRDPRVNLEEVVVYTKENGVILEVKIETVTGTSPLDLLILFDQEKNTVSYIQT